MEENKGRVIGCSSRERGEGVHFDRIRRITGYLSSLDQFCDSKKAEERDRVKHT